MKSIIEREATFENNSDMEVKVTQYKFGTFVLWLKYNMNVFYASSSMSDKVRTPKRLTPNSLRVWVLLIKYTYATNVHPENVDCKILKL